MSDPKDFVRMRARFLIVDDNDLVRRGLRTVFQLNPAWEVHDAPDGLAALESVKRINPDVVVMDFQMPGMDGIQASRRILEIAPSVIIVMFTQHASPELERYAHGVGIRSVVSKTDAFSMVRLIETLLLSSGSSSDIAFAAKEKESPINDPEKPAIHQNSTLAKK